MYATKDIKNSILSQLPQKWQKVLKNYDFENLEEIRFRAFLPVMLYYSGGKRIVTEIISASGDMEAVLGAICKNSVYAYRENITQGFVTLSGGHRAGLSGRGVVNGGKVSNLVQISGINIRLAREIPDCAKKVMPYILSAESVKNTILISPPSAGKTTMLRGIAKTLSENFKVCVIDERSELAAMSADFRGFDLGPQTDVYDGIPKQEGITMALRTLSPEVIITDEIDTADDIDAVKNILGAGAKIITSVHSENFEAFSLKKSEFLKLFDLAVVLSRRNGAGTVEEVQFLNGIYA